MSLLQESEPRMIETRVEIFYDRSISRFSSPDAAGSEAIATQIAKLNDCADQVQGWLGVKRDKGVFSHGFIVDLCCANLNPNTSLHAIYDEIGSLEGTDPRPSLTKKPGRMRDALRGLWHKHYFQPNFLVRNLMNETDRMVKDGRWEKMFAPHYGKFVEEFIGEVSHQMIIGAYEARCRNQQMTGEFIVYEKRDDGSNYYLTLGVHGEWDAIRGRVDMYRGFDVEVAW